MNKTVAAGIAIGVGAGIAIVASVQLPSAGAAPWRQTVTRNGDEVFISDVGITRLRVADGGLGMEMVRITAQVPVVKALPDGGSRRDVDVVETRVTLSPEERARLDALVDGMLATRARRQLELEK